MEAWAPFGEGRGGLFENPVLARIGAKYGKTPAQVMLRWHLQRGVVVIPKSTHIERMRENLNVFDFTLTTEDMAAIAALEDQIRTAPAEDSRNDGTQETFAATSEETMEAIVRKVLQQFGKLPTELDREERIALIAQFDQHGAFRFKGMVEHIASIMGISKYTLYSYRKACRQGPANGPQDPELPS